MSWTQVLARLAADFKYLDAAALRLFGGDRAKLNRYFAQTYDLTMAEASDTLDDWFAYKAARLTDRTAA